MAQAAQPYNPARTWDRLTPGAAQTAVTKPDEEREDVSIKIGKMIFYITCALGLWFFYWFNGIQCPC